MKIQKLCRDAVRSTERVDKTTALSRATLETVVGGGEDVPPEICAIHFYYPATVLD